LGRDTRSILSTTIRIATIVGWDEEDAGDAGWETATERERERERERESGSPGCEALQSAL
jgi:hypothetical protein